MLNPGTRIFHSGKCFYNALEHREVLKCRPPVSHLVVERKGGENEEKADIKKGIRDALRAG